MQKGFGWTNGVILDLLDKYGAKMIVSAGNLKILHPLMHLSITFIVFYKHFTF